VDSFLGRLPGHVALPISRSWEHDANKFISGVEYPDFDVTGRVEPGGRKTSDRIHSAVLVLVPARRGQWLSMRGFDPLPMRRLLGSRIAAQRNRRADRGGLLINGPGRVSPVHGAQMMVTRQAELSNRYVLKRPEPSRGNGVRPQDHCDGRCRSLIRSGGPDVMIHRRSEAAITSVGLRFCKT